eukprot:TRINITY_DN18501_c0_g1_i1.p1 TRINITY_DN18501_c0_g1~~TRINITY_DN18501_c0_g1_i1.p1  ORF type:complete len:670 (-),score=177.70 TRINITY_DN18501_c0_g1_i1:388-2250(-)
MASAAAAAPAATNPTTAFLAHPSWAAPVAQHSDSTLLAAQPTADLHTFSSTATGQASSLPPCAAAVAAASAAAVAGFLQRRDRRQRRSAGGCSAQTLSPVALAARGGDMTETDMGHGVQTEQAPDNLREWRLESTEKVRNAGGVWPAPKNDRLLRAARGEPVDRPPKWLMRQAGRYLPEYRAVLKTSDFFEVCQTPALACEVTLQPFRRYPTLDSLIIFSDILVIPVAMGMPCRMEPAIGPQFDFAIETPADLEKLNFKPDVHETLGYVFDAIFWTRQRVDNKVPVIGFSGAPWTLMGYMVEGGAVRSFDRAKKWLYLYPEESKKLLSALRDIIVEYLVAQYDSGAPLLQLFDTNTGEIPPAVYEEFMVDDLKYIATEIKRRRPNAILSVFPKDGDMAVFEDSDYDVVGVSWTASPEEARRKCPSKTLQGNLDPHLLYAENEKIVADTKKMVSKFGVNKLIANMGHGMVPSHPTRGPAAFIEGVDASTHDAIAALHAEGQASASSKAKAPGPQLTLHLQEGTSVSVPLSTASSSDLKNGLAQFTAMFKKKTEDKSPKKWPEFEHTTRQGDLHVEVFCNPNAYSSIFDVRIFLTVKMGADVKVSSEVPLSSLQSDLEAYLA